MTPEDHPDAVNAKVKRDVTFCNPAEKLYYELVTE